MGAIFNQNSHVLAVLALKKKILYLTFKLTARERRLCCEWMNKKKINEFLSTLLYDFSLDIFAASSMLVEGIMRRKTFHFLLITQIIPEFSLHANIIFPLWKVFRLQRERECIVEHGKFLTRAFLWKITQKVAFVWYPKLLILKIVI